LPAAVCTKSGGGAASAALAAFFRSDLRVTFPP
jgi:hypothetical protein